MGKGCAVDGCPSTYLVQGHHFSKNPKKSLEWQRIVKSERFKGLSISEIAKLRVCKRHFKQTDYVAHQQNRNLRPGAVPSLNLPHRESDDSSGTESSSPSNAKNIETQPSIGRVGKIKCENGIDSKGESSIKTKRRAEPEIECNYENEFSSSDSDDSYSESDDEYFRASSSSTERRDQRIMRVTKDDCDKSNDSSGSDKNANSGKPASNSNTVEEDRDLTEHERNRLTPKAKCLYEIARVMRRQNRINDNRKMRHLKTRLLSLRRLTKNGSLERHLRSLSTSERNFLQNHLRCGKKFSQKRPFTEVEELLAISTFQQFPVSYRFLQNVLVLPNV